MDMGREEAFAALKLLVGRDLRTLAERYGETVCKNGLKNKGWAGHVLETYLGLPHNSDFMADFGTWDLKEVSLKRSKSGVISAKETLAIDMINEAEVLSDRFEDSHLYDKLRRFIVVGRIYENIEETSSLVYCVARFDLGEKEMFNAVKADYQTIQSALRNGGLSALNGTLGKWVQPRTKGPGGGSTSRAFYARKEFVAKMLGIGK